LTSCWKKFLPRIDVNYTQWLRDQGSLTQRIQQRCQNFSVRPVQGRLAGIAYDESRVLGIPTRQLAYSREVFLYADGQPVVFAHSTCAQHHLYGAWRALGGMGSRPLGAMLFSHPLVKRQPLHYAGLCAGHPLYQSASSILEVSPPKLWARRSLFYLKDAPLLVTEVYFPHILTLD